MVAPGICHVKARLVDLIGSSGIENATSAQPKNLASAPRLSPLRFFGGVAGDETIYRAFQVACNWAMSCRSSHVIKLKLSSQLIGQFGHVTASASCKQPEKHGS